MAVEVERADIEGLDDLLRKFRRLGRQFQNNDAKNPINKALMAAALPIQKDAKQRALRFDRPETPTKVADNIVRSRVKKPKEMFEVGVMVRTKSKDPLKRTAYWHILEFGSVLQPAQPYMRPAGMAKRDEAVRIFVKRLADSIDKAAR